MVFCFSGEPPVVSLADLGTETSGISLSLSKIKLKELLIEVTSHGAAVHARKNGQDAIAIRGNKYVEGGVCLSCVIVWLSS